MPRLDVRICAARGLHNVETFGTIDPYVMIQFEGKQWRTEVADNTTAPEWDDAVFKFNCADENSSQVKFSIWNKNAMSDDFLGEYHMSISGLTRGEVDDKWVLVQQCKGNAELHIRMKAVDFGDLPEEEKEETAHVAPQGYPQQQPPQQQQYQQPPQQQQQYQQQPPQQQGTPAPLRKKNSLRLVTVATASMKEILSSHGSEHRKTLMVLSARCSFTRPAISAAGVPCSRSMSRSRNLVCGSNA